MEFSSEPTSTNGGLLYLKGVGLINNLSQKELYKMAQAFASLFIASYAEEPKVIILNGEATNA